GVVVVLGDDEPPSVREESGVAVVPRSAPHPTRRRRRRGGPDSFRARMTAAVLAACIVLAIPFAPTIQPPSAPVGQVIEVKVGSVAQTVVLSGVIEHEPDLPVRSVVA